MTRLTKIELVRIILQLDNFLLDQKLQYRLQILRIHSRSQRDIVVAQTISSRVEL